MAMKDTQKTHGDKIKASNTSFGDYCETVISREGSSRGTGYIESNKILVADGKLHVGWLDAGRGGKEPVRIKTLDLKSNEWSDTVTLGMAHDNHGGPVIVRDGNGYLHTLFGPHYHPFSYRRSVRPNDTSEWTPAESCGEACTYPSMVCDANNTLHMVCRGSNKPRKILYFRREEGKPWSKGRALIESTNKDNGYRCYRCSLFLDNKGCLHLGFMLFGGEHFKDAQEKGLAGYMCSEDSGETWTHFDGKVVKGLPTDADFERVPVTENCIRTSNLVVDPDRIPYITTVSTGFRGYSGKWGEAILWKRHAKGWQTIPLNAYIEDIYPRHRASWAEPSMSFNGEGRLFIALTVVDSRSVDPEDATLSGTHVGRPKSIFGNASSKLVLLTSGDSGRSFEARRIGQNIPDIPAWLPSLERHTGHNEIVVPHLLYTLGFSGTNNTPADVNTEIRLITCKAECK